MSVQEKLDLIMSLQARTLELIEKQSVDKKETEPAAPIPIHVIEGLMKNLSESSGNLGRKIDAIKIVRMLTAISLKEAKDLVEKYFH